MQKEVNTIKLFDENGEVSFGGWSRSPVFEYNKNDYPTARWITEKDCYFIRNKDMGFYISVETVSIELAIRIVLCDFKTGEIRRDSIVRKFLFDQSALPESGRLGEFSYTDKKIALTLTNTVEGRYIQCDFIDFDNEKNLFVKVLVRKQSGESMNIVEPFEENGKCFYHKRFVPRFTASGVIRFGGKDYALTDEASDVYFDWSRYVLPKKQSFQVLAGVARIKGRKLAINMASAVGDTKKGSENCYFLDNKLYKIGRLKVSGDEKSVRSEWIFESEEKDVRLTFTPEKVDGRLLTCKCEKLTFVFGRLNGVLVGEDFKLNVRNKRAHMIFATI